MNTASIYKNRFADSRAKSKIWKVLIKHYFQNFINIDETVLDLAAGYCEFINNINCNRKIAFDINPDSKALANNDVEIINESCEFMLNYIKPNSIDTVFISNFFEHLDKKEQIISILTDVNKILKQQGKVIILQPNIKLTKEAYWDFIDHKLALTDNSIIEAANISGFIVSKKISRFLPYTTKSKLPQFNWIIKLYLKLLPISGFIMGKQSLIILRKENA